MVAGVHALDSAFDPLGDRVIDAHHHLWDLDGPLAHDWLDAAELAPIRRSFGAEALRAAAGPCGIGGTVLVQVLNSEEETREFLAVAADNELVRGVVGWVDLAAPDIAERLAALSELPGGELLVGIRHLVQDEPDPQWLLRPEVLRGLRAVAAAGPAFDLVLRAPQWEAAERVVHEVGELRFVLDHLGKPRIASGADARWQGWIRRLAAAPNVSAKLSGLVTEADWKSWRVADLAPYAEAALAAFGPGRLMFGSDWPVCELAATYAEVTDAARELTESLSPAERAEVFAGTAERSYRLSPAG